MYKILMNIDLTEAYGRNLMQGIVRYSNEFGPWVLCRMPLYYKEVHGMKGVLEWAKEWDADAIVALVNTKEDMRMILDAGIPTIAQDYNERFVDIPNITGQYFETGIMGAEYLLSKGYENFAYYGFKDIVWSRERAAGFEYAVKKAGYSVFHFESDQKTPNDLWYYKPSSLEAWLGSLPKNIGLMACDDNQGYHVIEACNALGIKIPENMVVLGVDNDELVCQLSEPSLSSISLNTEQGGYDTARRLHGMIKNNSMNLGNIIIKPQRVVTRQSTDIYASEDEMVTRALKFIHVNVDQCINVTDVIGNVPLSRRALEMRFLKVTGQPIYKYIKKVRIGRIAEQLVKTNKMVSEIAMDFGLDDSSNVSRLFKREMGLAPEQYRKQHRQVHA